MYQSSDPANPASSARIRQMACEVAFGGPLITNNFRGLIAEAIVASVLGSEWRWCSADYAGWDFQRSDGLRLEVKQSAAKQTWDRSDGKPSVCSFDIKTRQGRYEGANWFEEPGRSAHLYVFAHHPITEANANHCEPRQWRFFVVPTHQLPDWKRIGLRSLSGLASPCLIDELAQKIDEAAAQLVDCVRGGAPSSLSGGASSV